MTFFMLIIILNNYSAIPIAIDLHKLPLVYKVPDTQVRSCIIQKVKIKNPTRTVAHSLHQSHIVSGWQGLVLLLEWHDIHLQEPPTETFHDLE